MSLKNGWGIIKRTGATAVVFNFVTIGAYATVTVGCVNTFERACVQVRITALLNRHCVWVIIICDGYIAQPHNINQRLTKCTSKF